MQQSAIQQLLKTSLLKPVALTFTLAIIFLTPPALSIAGDTSKQGISVERQKELTYMVRQDCGSCHGMTLKGGLGPSLLPERVSVLPKQYLIDAITQGRHDTPMPPWGPLLKQNEIEWIVEQLQSGSLGQKPGQQTERKP